MKKLIIGQSLLVLLWANGVFAGPSKWSSVTIFNQEPLEVKLGTFTDDMNSDLLTMVLWNDGSMNRLDAVRVPFPYNGTNVTTTSIENTATLFSLGDICRMGNDIIIPYIKNFNVEIAVYTMNNWFNMTIPETIGNSFDSADCAVSQDGVFVSGHDFDDSEIELFKLNPNLSGFTFYGKFGGDTADIAGPFDGGVRDTLVMDRDGSFSMSLYQGKDGMIRTARFDSSVASPTFTPTDVIQKIPPVGFTFVKESYGGRSLGQFVFGYNADSTAEIVEVKDVNPFSHRVVNFGSIDNTGTQLPFQGGAYLPNINADGEVMKHNIIWDEFRYTDADLLNPLIDFDYPLRGVGGPVATCRRQQNPFTFELYVAGLKVGGTGTDLHIKELESLDVIFADGFESGDTTAWSTCP